MSGSRASKVDNLTKLTTSRTTKISRDPDSRDGTGWDAYRQLRFPHPPGADPAAGASTRSHEQDHDPGDDASQRGNAESAVATGAGVDAPVAVPVSGAALRIVGDETAPTDMPEDASARLRFSAVAAAATPAALYFGACGAMPSLIDTN